MPRSAVRTFYVYILASRRRTLYTGVTSNIRGRLYDHRNGVKSGFASRYNCTSLVHLETFSYVGNAIAREKQIKGWLRKKKIALIESSNPDWKDLSEEWEW
jgi:putative endonuclease